MNRLWYPTCMNYRFIAIEGNIGSGKTTLAHMLAEHYGAQLLLEGFENNAFLPRFYENPERYAFSLEMSFLAERYQQLREVLSGTSLFNTLTISDYYLSKSLIFARTNLADDEYRLFWQLFHIMFQSIPKPDLLVYLYTPVEQLRENIRKRGRPYEQGIGADYLAKIQEQYLDFLRKHGDQLRVLLVNMEQGDFVARSEDFQRIVEAIEAGSNHMQYRLDF